MPMSRYPSEQIMSGYIIINWLNSCKKTKQTINVDVQCKLDMHLQKLNMDMDPAKRRYL